MICSEFYELLDNYGLISDEKRLEMEHHSQECESCRKELEFFHSILKISASIPLPSAPSSLIDEVNKRLDTERTTVIAFRPNFRVLSTIAACLAIGLAVGINNGYIKENISPADTDGVIKETVVATEAPVANPIVDEPVNPVTEGAANVKNDMSKKPVITDNASHTQLPTNAPVTATTVPTKTPVRTTPAPSTPKPTEQTTAPVPTLDTQDLVDKYEISETDINAEYGYYSAGTKGRVAKPDSDYLYVHSDDMGTVVSTMSEMGIKTVDGYYMSSREDFYELINILNTKGVGYECDLQNNMSDHIAFKLTYN